MGDGCAVSELKTKIPASYACGYFRAALMLAGIFLNGLI